MLCTLLILVADENIYQERSGNYFEAILLLTWLCLIAALSLSVRRKTACPKAFFSDP